MGTGTVVGAAVTRVKAFFKGTGFAGLLALLTIFLLQLSQPTTLSTLGNLVFDIYARAQPREYAPVPVKIVDIDEESLRRGGQWPWPRPDVAHLLQRLTDAGAATIALDIVFSEPDRTRSEEHTSELQSLMRNSYAVFFLKKKTY